MYIVAHLSHNINEIAKKNRNPPLSRIPSIITSYFAILTVKVRPWDSPQVAILKFFPVMEPDMAIASSFESLSAPLEKL